MSQTSPLAELLSQSGGWSALDKAASNPFSEDARKQNKAERIGQMQTQYEEAMLFKSVFGSGAGTQVLALLKKRCVEQLHFNPETSDAFLSILTGYFRSGEANLVLFIERMLRVAEQGPPIVEEEEKSSASEG